MENNRHLRSIGEAIQHLRAKGYHATLDKLRDYEHFGLIAKVPRQSDTFRRYSMADLKAIMTVMDLIAQGFRMAQIKRLAIERERVRGLKERILRGEIAKERVDELIGSLNSARVYTKRRSEIERAFKNTAAIFRELQKDLKIAEDALVGRAR